MNGTGDNAALVLRSFLVGAPGATRTHGTQIRNLVLYPPELRGLNFFFYHIFF